MSNGSNIRLFVHEDHKSFVLSQLGEPNEDQSEGSAFGGQWEVVKYGGVSELEYLVEHGISFFYYSDAGETWNAYERVYDGDDGDYQVDMDEHGCYLIPFQRMTHPDKLPCFFLLNGYGIMQKDVDEINGFTGLKQKLSQEWDCVF